MTNVFVVGEAALGRLAVKLNKLFNEVEKNLVNSEYAIQAVDLIIEKKFEFPRGISVEEQLESWRIFYKKYFNYDLDVSRVKIPERVDGYNRLIVVVYGMNEKNLTVKCSELFPTKDGIELVTLNFNSIHSIRVSNHGPYAVWAQDRVDAERDYENKSVDHLDSLVDFTGITLQERLLFEIKYYDEAGNHLDQEKATLCSGTRLKDGRVFTVYWYKGEMNIDLVYPNEEKEFIRARRVITHKDNYV